MPSNGTLDHHDVDHLSSTPDNGFGESSASIKSSPLLTIDCPVDGDGVCQTITPRLPFVIQIELSRVPFHRSLSIRIRHNSPKQEIGLCCVSLTTTVTKAQKFTSEDNESDICD